MTIRQDTRYTIYDKPTKHELPKAKVKSNGSIYGTIRTSYGFTGVSPFVCQVLSPTGMGDPWMQVGGDLFTGLNLDYEISNVGSVTGINNKIEWNLDPSYLGESGASHGEYYGLEFKTDEAEDASVKKFSPDIIIEISDHIVDYGITGSSIPNVYQGPEGSTGLQGATGIGYIGRDGITGLQGITGLDGAYAGQGVTGLEGPEGPEGTTGLSLQGVTGLSLQGVTGLEGPEGATGLSLQGVTGLSLQGVTGLFIQGETGISVQGATGLSITGLQGITGISGQQGTTGIEGPEGETGIYVQGETGLSITGLQGATGLSLQGVTGLEGPEGATGLSITGLQGITGLSIQGVTGISIVGETGQIGITGLEGEQGATGISIVGVTGLQGITGPDGITGQQGITGLSIVGVTGLRGFTGQEGSKGETGLSITGQQGETGTATIPDPINFDLYDNGNSGSSKQIQLYNGQKQEITISEAATIYMGITGVEGAGTYTIKMDYGGSYTPSFTGIEWAGDNEPYWSASASNIDLVTIFFDGTNLYGVASLGFGV